MMDLSELNELDFSEVSEWPSFAKAIVVVLLFAVILGGSYWFFAKDKLTQFDQLKNKEPQLKATFEKKQAKAVNLDSYKQQMEEMKISFGKMLQQLPSKAEVADLLVDITQTGLSSGLKFKLFKPGPEIRRDFYVELPIQIHVVGNYHQLGEFVSKVAALSRIVTLHDFFITRKGEGMGNLVMNITAKTYHYIDEDGRKASSIK